MSTRETRTPDTPDTVAPRPGDAFTFHGDDTPESTPDGRGVIVHSISMAGQVLFTITFLGEQTRGLHSAPLTEVLAMLEHGIWRPVARDV